MAVNTLCETLHELVSTELSDRRRYRCLVLQAGDMGVLSSILDYARQAVLALGEGLKDFDSQAFLDGKGAIACTNVLEQIASCAAHNNIVLSGPLHYIDYWTNPAIAAFWGYCASWEFKHGLLIVDTVRTEGVEGPFRLAGVVPGTDIRFLRSRLAAVEVGVR